MIYKTIKNKFYINKTNKHIRCFFKNIKLKKNGEKILIYAGIGEMYISYFEILLYNLLKKEGYDVGKHKFWNNTVNNSINLLKSANVNYKFI